MIGGPTRSGPASTPIRLHVNGRDETLNATSDASLLHVLRNDLALNGPKYGCGLGQCGACMVLIDGVAARACVIPASAMEDRTIITLEGLGTIEQPHPVQRAFIDRQAAQCGYCLNGMIVSTVALLDHTPRPTRAQIAAALAHNLCRCGTHVEIVEAVIEASERISMIEIPS
jgi:nicotinate dehydrogenase subunit A